MKTSFVIGQRVRCINPHPFPKKDIGPPLKYGETYIIKQIITTIGSHDHLDVGLVSDYTYISCLATEIKIPEGDKIHWCHPSRFEAI